MSRFTSTSLKFMILPAILLVLFECQARIADGKYWYNGTAKQLAGRRPDFIMVGSSHVGVGIDANVFSHEMARQVHRNVLCINQGAGYATAAEHYFAIKLLLERNPQLLKGTTVLIEAPAGIPKRETWSDDWLALPEAAYLLSPYLSWSDLVHYCQLPNVALESKAYTIAAKISAFSLRARGWRTKVFWAGESLVDGISAALTGQAQKREEKADLVEAAGVRSESGWVHDSRVKAYKESAQNMLNQKPADWDKAVIKDLVALVQENGGNVVFFDMPISSVEARPLKTAQRLSDKRTFAQHASKWGCPLITTEFSTTDDDFPDLYHLRKSRTEEFSRLLAKSVMDQQARASLAADPRARLR